jgi:hypothetical protein
MIKSRHVQRHHIVHPVAHVKQQIPVPVEIEKLLEQQGEFPRGTGEFTLSQWLARYANELADDQQHKQQIQQGTPVRFLDYD